MQVRITAGVLQYSEIKIHGVSFQSGCRYSKTYAEFS